MEPATLCTDSTLVRNNEYLYITVAYKTLFITASILAKSLILYNKLVLACVTLMFNLLFAEKSRWILMKFEGDTPPNRLDHSMCLLPWKVCIEGNSSEAQASSSEASETVNLAFVFGGMDTQGIIHNDCVVTVVT